MTGGEMGGRAGFDGGPLARRLGQQLLSLLDGIDRVQLVDFPYYFNIGDSLIALGQLEILNRLGLPIDRITGRLDPDRLSEGVGSRTAVLITGGGNFGTLWPASHDYRLAVVRACRSSRVIQLPQSVYFDELESVARTVSDFSDHPDAHVLVRDRQSLEKLVKVGLPRVQLAPDGAFGLPSLTSMAAPQVDVLVMRRADSESTHGSLLDRVCSSLTRYSLEKADWARFDDLPDDLRMPTVAVERRISLAERVLPLAAWRNRMWRRRVRSRWNLGCTLLQRGRVCVTDRLHVHVLCSLLGIPHVVLDNTYGKIRALADCWGTVDHALWPNPDEDSVVCAVELAFEAGVTGKGP